MTEVKVITKKNDYWVKIPKSVIQNEKPEIQNGKITAFVSGTDIKLRANNTEKSENYKGYKDIIKTNSNVLQRLADA